MGNRQGHWVFLNNVHLMPKFLTVVEKKIEEYSTSAQVFECYGRLCRLLYSQPNFFRALIQAFGLCFRLTHRPQSPCLFLTAASSSHQTHLRDWKPIWSRLIFYLLFVTMKRMISFFIIFCEKAFACFSRETYEELESRTKGILFGLCQFHAVMIERKKFGSKGYNMMYPFSLGGY